MPRATATRSDAGTGGTRSSVKGGRRTEQIARAAARLFQDLGYQNVSIDQIGAAVGLTGPAVYRHFKGKHDILVQALMSQVRLVDELAARADEGVTAQEQLDLFLAGLGDLTANGDEATLWRREQRHLEPAERDEFLADFATNRDRIAAKVMAAQPKVDERTAELLGFAVLAMYSNTPDIRGTLPSDRLIDIQSAVAAAIIGSKLPDHGPEAVTAPHTVHRRPAGRRERILEASAGLFDARGFYDVRIDDIAKASEMSVATLYQHVSGKTEVLRAILERGAEGLLYVTADALATADNPHQALDALIRTYIRQALGVHGRIMHILATDLLYLPDDEQAALRETQREYVAEWVDAICALDGDLSAADARALAQSAIGVITDVSQESRLRERPGIAEDLAILARAMVLPTGLVPQ
ncbi:MULTISPECIES: TetR/AcrR family transcriptional regulator [unclassified Rhodococcus (in: high G+C Gram-positive bacteria)]|uniref:TetR/AcrR family transcriptional regulator n=1 Tax=unclassified Rhodococcus (in: high G+C Gram-positive bacteria) TaxID=192944 RepID=UPI001639B38A|nr:MULTISPECIES: TetR/AcrR family transcriptional regulator [unclassified Rhodococcus (in: high G+C Gram-positive bacteria)]MBC2637675.1 TetR/AcrR family transcriptional regulator [Rhodococcus sp. 3A]MBC2897581.1 TetR/AcrR family transcriptional regulator [Rhodococcus sp. 4CII]